MTKTMQLDKNLKLTSKLAEYIVENPKAVADLPSEASYVVFSASDKKLNELNKKLFKNIAKSGQQVVKAEQTKSKTIPWKFSLAL